MSIAKWISGLMLLLMAASCVNANKNMEEMIPADATGVVSVRLHEILEKAGMLSDDKITIPSELQNVIDAHEGSVTGRVLESLPVSGLDLDCNLYFFFSKNTFRYVCLATLADEEAARRLIEESTGKTFSPVEDIDVICLDGYAIAIEDGVLLIGRENRMTDDNTLAQAARSMLHKSNKCIMEVSEVKKCLAGDNDINAYFELKGFNALIKTIPSMRNAIERYPVISIFTDSDVKALTVNMKFEKEGANLTAKIKADENSDFVTLLNTVLSKPDNAFLKAMPSTMKCVFAVSVKGRELTKLDQIKKSINLLSNLPSLDKLDIAGIINTIDGPLAIGLAPSFTYTGDSTSTFADDWNMAIAAKSTNPASVVNMVRRFASQMGQPDYIKGKHHVYDYQGKPVYVGTEGSIVYAMRLDHELTESSWWDMLDLQDSFAKCPIGFFSQSDVLGKPKSFLNFGFKSSTEGQGVLYTVHENDNTMLAFLEILCSIAPSHQVDENDYVDNYES